MKKMCKKNEIDEKRANEALNALDGIIKTKSNGRDLIKKVRKTKYIPKAT